MESFWTQDTNTLLTQLSSDEKKGLSQEEAMQRLEKVGTNSLGSKKKSSPLLLFLSQFKSPISLILLFATMISLFMKDYVDSVIIFAIILISGLLGFFQEYRAGNAVSALLNLVRIKANVLRDGHYGEIFVEEIVPGDIVFLSTGDVVPADGILLSSKNLNIDESTLTGETFPVEKEWGKVQEDTPLAKRSNSLWMGTHVSSGSGNMMVVATGKNTEFGKISQTFRDKASQTDFEKGIHAFGMMLMQITTVIMLGIFAINLVLKKPVFDSFMFSLALAVGLTPQLLPAIISINLSHGAKKMAEKKVIVKKLNSIENFGSMEILCTDKTGTITQGKVKLAGIYDAFGGQGEEEFKEALLNSSLQSGFINPIDLAIKEAAEAQGLQLNLSQYRKLDEKPYNFVDRRLSVALDLGEERLFGHTQVVISKGALENILAICTRIFGPQGELEDLSLHLDQIRRSYEAYSQQGFRTLGLCYKPLEKGEAILFDQEMIFSGFITLHDPLKEDVKETIEDLSQMGVDLKIITGDNALVARHIAEALGVQSDLVLTGGEMAKMSSDALSQKVQEIFVFAEVEPNQKERIIEALQHSKKVVGYMGDGINDAPALRKADVSISVDTGADVAKDTASIVLLEENLDVLVDGILEGRKTFSNTMKYIFMATSANFGNMFSMAGASLLLPFLPLLPKQVLLTNLLTDLPEMEIATDKVDPDRLEKPHKWDLRFVKKFMVVFGLLSSIFDYLTFGAIYFLFGDKADLFRSVWFVESVMSASIIVFVLRTRGRFYENPPSRSLFAATVVSLSMALFLPYSPLARPLGFVKIPLKVLMVILAIVGLYVVLTEVVKHFFYQKNDY